MNPIERFFEQLLWNSRLIVVLPVIASVLLAIGVLIITSLDMVRLIGEFIAYATAADGRSGLQTALVASIIAIVDNFLLGAVLLIFGLGLYELFIGKINMAEGSEFAERLLLIRSFDDLKTRLGGVILLILVVKGFQTALKLTYSQPSDLLILAVAILLISVALFLTGRKSSAK